MVVLGGGGSFLRARYPCRVYSLGFLVKVWSLRGSELARDVDHEVSLSLALSLKAGGAGPIHSTASGFGFRGNTHPLGLSCGVSELVRRVGGGIGVA